MQPHCYLRRAAARSFRQRRWSTAAAAAPQPLPPLRKGKRHVLSNASVIATSTMSSRQFATCRRGSGGGCCTYDTYPYPYFYHYHATHKRLRSLFSTTSNVTMEASTAHGTTALPQQQQPQPQPLPPPPSPKLYTPEQKQVMDQCKQWHSSITELNERVRF